MKKPTLYHYYDLYDVASFLTDNGFKEGPFNQLLVDKEPRNGSLINLEFSDILWDDGGDYTDAPKYRVPQVRSMKPELKDALAFLQKELGNCISIKYWW